MPLLDDVVVREFRMDDKQLVTDFFDQMGGESRSFINRGDSSRILSMKFFEEITEDRVMFLAEYEGRMVGFIFLFENNTSIPFFGIAVHDAYKGRRIGEGHAAAKKPSGCRAAARGLFCDLCQKQSYFKKPAIIFSSAAR